MKSLNRRFYWDLLVNLRWKGRLPVSPSNVLPVDGKELQLFLHFFTCEIHHCMQLILMGVTLNSLDISKILRVSKWPPLTLLV